mmetsp:Transcript_32535/g.70318  ORF Transcript_32535/g.70318 Transcript_32535/m.70318 type:complete len:224 (+) Transcript_32535:36-707(+)
MASRSNGVRTIRPSGDRAVPGPLYNCSEAVATGDPPLPFTFNTTPLFAVAPLPTIPFALAPLPSVPFALAPFGSVPFPSASAVPVGTDQTGGSSSMLSVCHGCFPVAKSRRGTLGTRDLNKDRLPMEGVAVDGDRGEVGRAAARSSPMRSEAVPSRTSNTSSHMSRTCFLCVTTTHVRSGKDFIALARFFTMAVCVLSSRALVGSSRNINREFLRKARHRWIR